MTARQISTEDAIAGALRQRDSPQSREALSNADVVKAMAAQLEATLALAKADSAATLALGLAKKGLSHSKLIEKSSGSKALKVGNFFVDEMVQTLSLLKLANAVSPGAAVATAGTVLLKKTATAFNFGATTRDQKCIAAWLDLAGSAAAGAFALPTAMTPIGALILVASAAQVVVAWQKTRAHCGG